MIRFVAIPSVIVLGLLTWSPGQAAAVAHLVGRPAPEIAGGLWLNSPALTLDAVRGRVVLVEFWTSG